MRIIAGSLGGRLFDSPSTHRTHPMSDKMRGALFNILGDIDGLTVLDAFAGSGALSFEAISRGAASALAIDADRTAQRTIESNVASLDLASSAKLIKATANAWLSTNPEARFDIVLCDPPYDDVQPALLKKLAGCVADGGTFVLSWPAGQEPPDLPPLQQLDVRSYGDAQLIFYK
jgi:16S rRNA (guanine966-N2)-methyltransferase